MWRTRSLRRLRMIDERFRCAAVESVVDKLKPSDSSPSREDPNTPKTNRILPRQPFRRSILKYLKGENRGRSRKWVEFPCMFQGPVRPGLSVLCGEARGAYPVAGSVQSFKCHGRKSIRSRRLSGSHHRQKCKTGFANLARTGLKKISAIRYSPSSPNFGYPFPRCLSLARDRDAGSQWPIDGGIVNKHLTHGLQLFILLLAYLSASGQASASQILNRVMGTGGAPSTGTSAASGNSDPLGRSTPHGTVFGFLQSAQLGNTYSGSVPAID